MGSFHKLSNPVNDQKNNPSPCFYWHFGFYAHAQSVVSDQNTSTDFKKFKTYAWLAPGDSVLNRYRSDKLYSGYIVHSANKELASRGLKVDTLKPDAIFLFYTTVEEITTYSQSATLSMGVGVAGPDITFQATLLLPVARLQRL